MAGKTSGRFSRYPAVNRDVPGGRDAGVEIEPAELVEVAKVVEPVDDVVVEDAPAPKKPRKKAATKPTEG
jgi:hypothetical protein